MQQLYNLHTAYVIAFLAVVVLLVAANLKERGE